MCWIWLMGYLNAGFFVSNFRKEESVDLLKAYGCEFVEVTKPKELELNNISNERTSSFLNKVFSKTSEEILIGHSKHEERFIPFWIILTKSWLPFNSKRTLNFIEITDSKVLESVQSRYESK